MNIRQARPADAEGIVGLVNPVIRQTAITFTTEEKTIDGVAEVIRAGMPHFVACRDGEIIGYACYFQFRGGPGYRHTMEHSITLDKGARGVGLGRRLMTHLEDHARRNNVHSLFAGVSSENPAGVAFHRSIGFTEVGYLPQVGHKFGRWMDLVLLQKLL